MCKENKNNNFIQQFLLFHVSLHHAFTRVPQRMRVVLLTQEPAFLCRTRMHCALTKRMTCNFFAQPYLFAPEYTDDELREMDVLRQNAGSCVKAGLNWFGFLDSKLIL